MCEREREFCDLLIFRSIWKWFRCGNPYLFSSQGIDCATFSTSCFFESLPKVFRLLYLGPTRPTSRGGMGRVNRYTKSRRQFNIISMPSLARNAHKYKF